MLAEQTLQHERIVTRRNTESDKKATIGFFKVKCRKNLPNMRRVDATESYAKIFFNKLGSLVLKKRKTYIGRTHTCSNALSMITCGLDMGMRNTDEFVWPRNLSEHYLDT
jgi:hypothetical protein